MKRMRSWRTAAVLAACLLVPAVANAGGLTIARAVQMALANHPDLAAAREQVTLADVSIDTARAAFQPDVSAGASGSSRLQGGSGTAGSATLDGTVSMKLNLYRGGADASTLDQAGMKREASAAGLERLRETLVNDTVDRYLAALVARELVAVREENLAWNRGQLEFVKAQYEAGSRSITDLYSQEATTEKASFELVSARGELESATLSLAEIAGWPQGSAIELAGAPEVNTDSLLPAGDQEGIVSRALAARRDVAAQRASVGAAAKGITLASAGSSPSVDLTASLGSAYSSTSDDDAWEQVSGESLGTSVGVSVTIPLWDRHVTRNAVSQARSQEAIERAALERLERQVRLEVGIALQAYQTAQAQLASAAKQVESAAKALDAAEARYQTGVSTLLEVTQARSLYTEARSSAVEAGHGLLAKAVALACAAGEMEPAMNQLIGREAR